MRMSFSKVLAFAPDGKSSFRAHETLLRVALKQRRQILRECRTGDYAIAALLLRGTYQVAFDVRHVTEKTDVARLLCRFQSPDGFERVEAGGVQIEDNHCRRIFRFFDGVVGVLREYGRESGASGAILDLGDKHQIGHNRDKSRHSVRSYCSSSIHPANRFDRDAIVVTNGRRESVSRSAAF